MPFPRPRFAALALVACTGLSLPVSAAEPPALVLLLAIDQLRRDRVDASLPGGLGRLAREGRLYTQSMLEHAATETCPGHVTMLSGRHPGPAGVPGNRFIDRDSGRRVYCVEDPSEDGRVFGAQHGRSPRLFQVDFLGDWMKQARPETRVFSVSGKDRSAVALGGKRADAAYWLEKGLEMGESVGFTTSRYYTQALPGWVQAFNGLDPLRDGLLADVPERWEHGPIEAGDRPDDYPAEDPDLGRTSGRRVRDDSLEDFAERVSATPFLDDITLSFAEALIENEGLGQGAMPDLLAIGLSATDLVGHHYGPESHEAIDALRRLDLALRDFFEFLEGRLGPDRVLIVLTSDHGVLPLPEWLVETGRSQCPVEDGRSGIILLGLGLRWKLHRSFAPLFSWPQEWVHFSGSRVTVNRSLAREREVSVKEIVKVTERYLEAQPAIVEAWTEEEIESRDSPLAQLYRNAFHPERSGDLAIQVAPTCLITRYDYGTSHGSPYEYDLAVPLIFFGPGVPAGRIEGRAAPIDIAPTLARLLELEVPEGLDGRVLFE